MKEGRLRIDEDGHEVYYALHGSGGETLIALHGGPGADHRYLDPLKNLAEKTLQVLLYDQLGGGRSDRPSDPSLWTVPRFVQELETIRTRLGLGRIHLLGQSWGGMLALQYVLDHPDAVKSLILSNTGASGREIFQGMLRLRGELDPAVLEVMLRHEAAGTYSDPEYQQACHEIYARNLRRSTPYERQRSLAELRDLVLPLMNDMGPAYQTMWGPQEFLCTGPLMDWDVTPRLGEISVPTLILCGWFDEVTMDLHRVLADRIRDNEFLVFGHSSHLILMEKEGEAYMGVIRDFLQRRRRR